MRIVNEVFTGIWKACLIILFLFTIMVIWLLHASRILPYTKKVFSSYEDFYKKTGSATPPYPENLPIGAGNIRYYYHEGMFDIKTSVSFTTSDEDYQKIKETYLLSYKTREDNDRKSRKDYMAENRHVTDEAEGWESGYVFNEKLTSGFLEEEELEYLEKVFHESADCYTILAYKGDAEGGERCYLEGVFCNDETNEVVMFGFRDAFRKNRQ